MSKLQGQVINQVLIRKGEIHIGKYFGCLLNVELNPQDLFCSGDDFMLSYIICYIIMSVTAFFKFYNVYYHNVWVTTFFHQSPLRCGLPRSFSEPFKTFITAYLMAIVS